MLLPWRKMWDFLGACDDAPDLAGMMRQAVDHFPRVISCDHALSFLVTRSPLGRDVLARAHACGVPMPVLDAYRRRWFCEDAARLSVSEDRTLGTFQVDWRDPKLQKLPFTREFMRGMLESDLSAGIQLWPEQGGGVFVLVITRRGVRTISGRDEAILRSVRPHLARLFLLHDRLSRLPAENYLASELARGNTPLSPREGEIAGLLCRRLRRREIGDTLGISLRTVETHIQHIYSKLHVNSRAELLHRLMR